MRITQKGQVTIPQEVRSRLGLLPYTEVEFEIAGDHARIRKAARSAEAGARGSRAVEALWELLTPACPRTRSWPSRVEPQRVEPSRARSDETSTSTSPGAPSQLQPGPRR